MAKETQRAVRVFVWGELVGAVAFDPRLGAYVFNYTPEWARRKIELAPLTMPLREYDPSRPFAFPSLSKDTFKGLPGLLADSLPDTFGNALIDAWMAGRGVKRPDITTLDRLCYMGKRGLGALEFKPAKGSRAWSKAPIEMRTLVEQARRALRGDFSNDAAAQAALANIIQVGTSAGGARAKAVVAWNPKTEEIRSGQFEVERGFEHWLIKFDGVGKDADLGSGAGYGRIEYAYYLMATAAGIKMSPSRLLEENGRAHFMTKRFDRDGNRKHHVQSLCALGHIDFNLKATNAYSQYFQAAAALKLPASQIDQIFLRMAFNVMAKNCDDHSKNFSFILPKGGSWCLAPAYDVTHAYNSKSEWTYQHLMSVNGKFDNISTRDLLAEGARFGVSSGKELLEHVRAALSGWPKFAAEAGMTSADAKRIGTNFRR